MTPSCLVWTSLDGTPLRGDSGPGGGCGATPKEGATNGPHDAKRSTSTVPPRACVRAVPCRPHVAWSRRADRGGHPVPEPLTPSPKKRSVGAQDPKCTYARSWGARSAATPCQRRRGGRDARSSAGDRWTTPTRSRRRGGGGDTRVVTSYISCANEANAPHEDLSENSESCDARMPEPTVDGSPPYAYGPRGSKLRGRARPTPPLLT